MIRKGLFLSAPFLLIIWAMSAYGWLNVDADAQVPLHWGLDGQPDRYGSVFEALIVMPAVFTGVAALLAVFPMIDPRGRNLRRSSSAYLVSWLGIMALLTAIHVAVVLSATGRLENDGADVMPQLVGSGVSILLIAIGNMLGKARPNWFFGIRTPWTLSSDLAWDKTHRVTGRLMVLGGIAMLAAILFLPSSYSFAVILLGSVVPALFGIAYSYLVWKSDPARETHSATDEDE